MKIIKRNNLKIILSNSNYELYLEYIFNLFKEEYFGQTCYLDNELFKQVCPKQNDWYYNFRTNEFDKDYMGSFFSLVQNYSYCIVIKLSTN